jgi:CheY-like chemotaxis protein
MEFINLLSFNTLTIAALIFVMGIAIGVVLFYILNRSVKTRMQKALGQLQDEIRTLRFAATNHLPAADVSTFPVNVLLAENDEVSQLVAQKMLEHLGARVTCVRNGEAAVAAFADAQAAGTPFAIGLFDLRIPKISGLEAARSIRAQESGRAQSTNTTPATLIALSTNTFDDDQSEALNAGIQCFSDQTCDFITLS